MCFQLNFDSVKQAKTSFSYTEGAVLMASETLRALTVPGQQETCEYRREVKEGPKTCPRAGNQTLQCSALGIQHACLTVVERIWLSTAYKCIHSREVPDQRSCFTWSIAWELLLNKSNIETRGIS